MKNIRADVYIEPSRVRIDYEIEKCLTADKGTKRNLFQHSANHSNSTRRVQLLRLIRSDHVRVQFGKIIPFSFKTLGDDSDVIQLANH